MPSTTHQALVELFRVRPALAVELLAPELLKRAVHAALPSFVVATSTESALDQLVPVEFRADLVVELKDALGVLLGVIVIEVQLGADADKPWTWPLYIAALRARKRCSVWLLVVAPDEAVAAWARTPIELTPGVPCVLPVVLGPGELPPITEPEVAQRHPELTLLAAVASARGPDAERLLPALPAAINALDVDHRAGYLSMLLEAPALRKHLEELMVHPSFAAIKLPSPWQEILDDVRDKAQAEGQARGQAEGKARGQAEGKADSVLSVLTSRGIEVPDEVRAKILACTDVAVLDRWLRRAVTLKTAAAVVRDPAKKSRPSGPR